MSLSRLILAALIGLAAGLWTWTTPGEARPLPHDPSITGYLLDNGFHTDLALPRAELERLEGPLSEAVRNLAPGEWILVGWGDAKFYVDQRPIGDRLPDGARAFFRPANASVVMLDPSQADPRAFAPASRRAVRMSPAQFRRAAAEIEGSLVLADGRARVVTRRRGDDALFFASREHFWIGHLCNHWTAGVLDAAGFAVRPLRSVTSAEVMAAVDRAELDSPASRD